MKRIEKVVFIFEDSERAALERIANMTCTVNNVPCTSCPVNIRKSVSDGKCSCLPIIVRDILEKEPENDQRN